MARYRTEPVGPRLGVTLCNLYYEPYKYCSLNAARYTYHNKVQISSDRSRHTLTNGRAGSHAFSPRARPVLPSPFVVVSR